MPRQSSDVAETYPILQKGGMRSAPADSASPSRTASPMQNPHVAPAGNVDYLGVALVLPRVLRVAGL